MPAMCDPALSRPLMWMARAGLALLLALFVTPRPVVFGATGEDTATEGQSAEDLAAGEPVSFRREVMAVLSKAGCNMGACHGNQKGKGGFFLSLRGQSPDFDYQSLVSDASGRRVNRVDPTRSLILLKPTAQVPHEGGQRFTVDSPEFDVLRRWIAQGARDDGPDAPRLERLAVEPAESVVFDPQKSVALSVAAEFSDGTRRDVTYWAVYEASNLNVAVSPDGIVSRAQYGEATVLVRYLDRQVPVRVAFMPSRPDFQWPEVATQNEIDVLIFDKLQKLRIAPSEEADDRTFLRRAYIDLLGLWPTAPQAREFLADPRPDKRARLIDELMQRPEFADLWALKWSDVLRNEEKVLDPRGVETFHGWIREAFATGQPLDEFVRQILASEGSTYKNPPTNFYRALRDPTERAEAVARVFLGQRLQCARCHNHPYDVWSQDDYYDWASVFATVDYEILENNRTDDLDKNEFNGEQIVFTRLRASVPNPRTGKPAVPRLLGSPYPLSDDVSRLEQLAWWLTSGDNLLFAKAQVNRIWKHLMGRGLVDPVDDFRSTNPPSHPELLDFLARDFIQHGYDIRHTIRMIMRSATYQRSHVPNSSNAGDEVNYAYVIPRRLSAEQILDAQAQLLACAFSFNGYTEGIRAGQLPGIHRQRRRDRRSGVGDRFLKMFGKPDRQLACECERSDETTLGQALTLVAGQGLHEALTRPDNRLGEFVEQGGSREEIVEQLYWWALSRSPSDAERESAEAAFSDVDTREAIEDVAWALLNSKEFLFRP